jgi:streptogramin lyase
MEASMLRKLGVGLAVCAAVGLAPGLAAGAPTLAGEFDVAGDPKRLTVGTDGTAWVSVPFGGNDIARVTSAGAVTPFDLPNVANAVGPAGLATASGGRIWGTADGGIVSFDPADPENTATFLPIISLATPDDLVFGPGGRLYAVGLDGGAQARIFIIDTTTAPGVLVNAGGTVVTGLQTPKGIAAGTDGLLYIGDFAGKQVVSFNPADSATVAYPVGDGVQGVGAGPAGQIAYTVPSDALGRLTAGGTPQPTTVTGSDSFSIKLGSDGAYWAPGFVNGTAIRFATDGTFTEPITFGGTNPGPRHVAIGPDKSVWFSLEFPDALGQGRVARITGVEPPPPPPSNGGGTTPVTPPPTSEPTPLIPPPGMTRPNAPRSVRVGRAIPVTTTFTQNATLLVRVHRILPGKRAAGRCVAPRPALRKARGCVRYVLLGSFARPRAAGAVRVAVGPRIGKKRLTVGGYRIGLRARSSAGLVSPWRTVVVRVAR